MPIVTPLCLLFSFLVAHAAADPRARAEAIVDAAHSAETRACFEVRLPSASKLEIPYTVSAHATEGEFVGGAWVLDIERGVDRTRVRRLDPAGERVFELSADAQRSLDAWAETAVVLAGAVQADRSICLGGRFGFASHTPSQVVIVRARGKVRVQTAATQAFEDGLDAGLPAFTSAWTARELGVLVRGWTHGIESIAVASKDAKARLSKLPSAHGSERAAIEARLLAHGLGAGDDRTAIKLLRRRGFEGDALRLDLRTTPRAELAARLAPLLCAADFDTRTLATGMLDALGADARGPLLHASGCRLDPWATAAVIERLAALAPDAASRKAIDTATAPGRPLRVQVTARAARHAWDGGAADLDFLERTARGPEGALVEMSDEQRLALSRMDRAASRSPDLQPRVAALAAELLSRIPLTAHATYSGMAQLVELLGRLDARGHEAEIRRTLAHDDASVVVEAIGALARFDLTGARDEAIARVRLYNAGKTSGAAYSWNVMPYYELFIRADATAALAELRDAGRVLEAGDEADAWRLGSHLALVQYLAVRGETRRAAAAVEFVRAHGRPTPSLVAFWAPGPGRALGDAGLDAATIDAAVAEFDRRASTWP